MFESSEFLNLYLPSYFQKVYLRTSPSLPQQNALKSSLTQLASFIKFSQQLFCSLNAPHKHFQFLTSQLPLLKASPASLAPKLSFKATPSPQSGKIMEVIESKLDKVSLTFVQLYLKLLKIRQQIENRNEDNDTNQKVELFLGALNEARLQYQMFRFEVSDLEDYDQYVVEVFRALLQDNVSEDLETVVKFVLESQCANIGDICLEEIYTFMVKNRVKPSQSHITEASNTNESQKWFKNLLRSKTKKAPKYKGSPIQKKALNFDRKSPTPMSPNKPQPPKHRESHSPMNRIQTYNKTKKQKPINKKRTIYYQRKNLHVPKMKEWIDKMNIFTSELTLNSVSQFKKTQKKLFKFQHSQSTIEDFDNESMLVRSTPKPAKKMNGLRVISHKLDF